MSNSKIQMLNHSNQKGFSFMEMIVALGIFVLLSLVLANIFITIITKQRADIETQNAYDDLRYAMELMMREVRTSTNYNLADGGTSLPLSIVNQAGEAVDYMLASDQLMRQVNGEGYLALTSGQSDIILQGLEVIISPNQQLLTLVFKAQTAAGDRLILQSTVSSRDYH